MKKTIILIMIILVNSVPVAVPAKDLGKYGATYAIVEEDWITMMKNKISKYDWGKFEKQQIEKIKNYKPKDLADLPAAAEDKIFKVDMTYTLKDDIVGRDGVVLYPRGYQFNPMEYVFMRRIIVFINGKDERQIDWYKKSPYPNDMRTMLLITDGSYLYIKNRLKTAVYYATREIIDRMGIKAVPSVAVQKGTDLEVREYALTEKKK